MDEDDMIETVSTSDGAARGLLKGEGRQKAFLICLGKLIEVATVEDKDKLRKAFPAEWYHEYYAERARRRKEQEEVKQNE